MLGFFSSHLPTQKQIIYPAPVNSDGEFTAARPRLSIDLGLSNNKCRAWRPTLGASGALCVIPRKCENIWPIFSVKVYFSLHKSIVAVSYLPPDMMRIPRKYKSHAKIGTYIYQAD